jgi:hypothetical protein
MKITQKKLRLYLGSLTLCIALLMAAWHGNLDWMGIMAFAALFGLPEAVSLVKLLMGRNQ